MNFILFGFLARILDVYASNISNLLTDFLNLLLIPFVVLGKSCISILEFSNSRILDSVNCYCFCNWFAPIDFPYSLFVLCKVKENSSFCSQGSGNQFLVLSVALSSLRFSSFTFFTFVFHFSFFICCSFCCYTL